MKNFLTKDRYFNYKKKNELIVSDILGIIIFLLVNKIFFQHHLTFETR